MFSYPTVIVHTQPVRRRKTGSRRTSGSKHAPIISLTLSIMVEALSNDLESFWWPFSDSSPSLTPSPSLPPTSLDSSLPSPFASVITDGINLNLEPFSENWRLPSSPWPSDKYLVLPNGGFFAGTFVAQLTLRSNCTALPRRTGQFLEPTPLVLRLMSSFRTLKESVARSSRLNMRENLDDLTDDVAFPRVAFKAIRSVLISGAGRSFSIASSRKCLLRVLLTEANDILFGRHPEVPFLGQPDDDRLLPLLRKVDL